MQDNVHEYTVTCRSTFILFREHHPQLISYFDNCAKGSCNGFETGYIIIINLGFPDETNSQKHDETG